MLRIRILVIDDEPRWIDFAKNSLLEFELVAVSSTDEAAKLLEKNRFALVIASSLHLEKLDELLGQYGERPLFVTSAEPTRKEARDAYRKGAKRYLPKTFDAGDLRANIEDVVLATN